MITHSVFYLAQLSPLQLKSRRNLMLSDLLPLKSSSSVNIRASLNSELIVTPELSSMLLKLFRNTFSKRPATIVDGALCVQNSTNDKTCQTTYLSFQWLTRVAECEGFLVALLPYSELAESLKRIMGENVMSRLPTPDWRTKLDAADINIIDEFIQNEIANPDDQQRFDDFLDGRSWLNEMTPTKRQPRGLVGRGLERGKADFINSAFSSVARLVNENAGSVKDFIQLYVEQPELRSALSSVSLRSASHSQSKVAGENVIFYGAPGSGKSYKINQTCTDRNSVRTVFHPDTQYSDFVGSLKPSKDGAGDITYSFRPGPFTKALIEASKVDSAYFLVIEEINRASAAAVFGEIFQLLDREPDGASTYGVDLVDADMIEYLVGKAPSLLTEGKLKLPKNLSFWASMNSSDQAVMPMDTAFKRRWRFEYIANDFEKKVPNGYIEIPISDSEKKTKVKVSWKDFAILINEELKELSLPEDRHLGPWFLSQKELFDEESSIQALSGKLLLYLWDDVLRHYHNKPIFKSTIKGYGVLSEELKAGNSIFNTDFEKELVNKAYISMAETKTETETEISRISQESTGDTTQNSDLFGDED